MKYKIVHTTNYVYGAPVSVCHNYVMLTPRDEPGVRCHSHRVLIRPTPQVQVVITMDGFGAPAAKLSKYDLFIRDERVQFAGLKLFYKQDLPLLTPREVVYSSR